MEKANKRGHSTAKLRNEPPWSMLGEDVSISIDEERTGISLPLIGWRGYEAKEAESKISDEWRVVFGPKRMMLAINNVRVCVNGTTHVHGHKHYETTIDQEWFYQWKISTVCGVWYALWTWSTSPSSSQLRNSNMHGMREQDQQNVKSYRDTGITHLDVA
jgi:hypothetical protein